MRRLIFTSITLLILFSLTIENQINAQHRRGRTRTQAGNVTTTGQEIDRGTPEERVKLVEECSTPDRVKPEVELEQKGKPLLCGKAISLPKPDYPPDAKAQNISGRVVNIVIDEKGRVIWAQAVEGHHLLRQASVKAACQSIHSPTTISGRAVKAASLISYNFVNQ